jgi:hypothetical protein
MVMRLSSMVAGIVLGIGALTGCKMAAPTSDESVIKADDSGIVANADGSYEIEGDHIKPCPVSATPQWSQKPCEEFTNSGLVVTCPRGFRAFVIGGPAQPFPLPIICNPTNAGVCGLKARWPSEFSLACCVTYNAAYKTNGQAACSDTPVAAPAAAGQPASATAAAPAQPGMGRPGLRTPPGPDAHGVTPLDQYPPIAPRTSRTDAQKGARNSQCVNDVYTKSDLSEQGPMFRTCAACCRASFPDQLNGRPYWSEWGGFAARSICVSNCGLLILKRGITAAEVKAEAD